MLIDWLKILRHCRIDLQDYGEWEKLNTREEDQEFEFTKLGEGLTIGPRPRRTAGTVRLINFAYGPRPEDWKFWFSDPTDAFAGNFWALIEESTPCGFDQEALAKSHAQPMPGSWSEDFS